MLLPICVVAALFLLAEGVPQTLSPSAEVTTLGGGLQVIARGPVATQEAIKLLSGDGGGFFNANSAHPFENPTPLTNLAEVVLIFALGRGLDQLFWPHGGVRAARMDSAWRHGDSVRARRRRPLSIGIRRQSGSRGLESRPDDKFCNSRAETWKARKCALGSPDRRSSPNVSTASSDGAVNAMHDSFLPLSGGILLANMMVDEVIVGAPGSGLYGCCCSASSPSSSPGS